MKHSTTITDTLEAYEASGLAVNLKRVLNSLTPDQFPDVFFSILEYYQQKPNLIAPPELLGWFIDVHKEVPFEDLHAQLIKKIGLKGRESTEAILPLFLLFMRKEEIQLADRVSSELLKSIVSPEILFGLIGITNVFIRRFLSKAPYAFEFELLHTLTTVDLDQKQQETLGGIFCRLRKKEYSHLPPKLKALVSQNKIPPFIEAIYLDKEKLEPYLREHKAAFPFSYLMDKILHAQWDKQMKFTMYIIIVLYGHNKLIDAISRHTSMESFPRTHS